MESPDTLYENSSSLDADEITAFQNYMLKKTSMAIAIAIAVFFAAVGIGLAFLNTYVGVSILIAGIIGGLIIFPYISKESMKKQNAELFGGKNYVVNFKFSSSGMEVVNIDQTDPMNVKEAGQSFAFNEIFKAVVYKTHIFIFTNRHQSFILDQKGMTKGTAGEVLEVLKNNGVKVVDKSALPEPQKDKK